MMMIGDVLFPLAAEHRTTVGLLRWWESRRITFNLMVGGTGIVTLGVVNLIASIPPGVPVGLAWRPVLAYGIMANLCYSVGWLLEATAQRMWGPSCPKFGPALFRQGVAFSVGLTLLPIAVVSVGWVVRAIVLLVRS